MAKAISVLAALILFAILVLQQTSSAATIYGNIYDEGLNRLDNVIVEINSKPEQLFVAKNGSYEFFVPEGDYILKAGYYDEMYIEENISVASEGDYALDLILMPNVTDVPMLESELIEDEFENGSNYLLEGGMILLAIAAIAIIVRIGWAISMKKGKKRLSGKKIKDLAEEGQGDIAEGEDFKDRIVEMLRKQGGRTTQKEIRKELPYSEAKISLVIAELEHKGIVEKIKKGRGNIIILKKR
ncbi:hypothetical protein COV19_01495 [Candidatus Woesearchaeota archaeon CG10_big_fil_rev_8_21_14_0_10_44_13]|nr:MAG: hypothetical protein COV19_01495 [Candidatus Woesearchaeota archaeon CG10_big_fil_rev_8_21_14_0_10_44_13]